MHDRPTPAWLRRATCFACLGFTLAGVRTAPAASVTALQADQFVGTTGVATHWRLTASNYGQFAQMSDKLADLGLRFTRDTGSDPAFTAKLQKLGSAGVKTILIVNPPSGTKPNATYWGNPPNYAINDYVRLVGPNVIKFVEMNNELDSTGQQALNYWHSLSEPISNVPTSPYYFPLYLQAATADAWTQLSFDSDPAIAVMPLIGPSLIYDDSYDAVGNLGANIEFSNVHHYYVGWHPEVTNDKGIDDVIATQSHVQSPVDGYIATEGGDSTASIQYAWPLTAHGRYIPRYYLSHFIKGFAVTCAYELADAGLDPLNKEQNFGLLKNDLSEKPGYAALKNVLSVLKDPGVAFTPGSLNYTLSGSTTNVWSVLFQKRNGDFYFCFWLGVECYNPSTGANVTVPSQAVTLNVPASIVSAKTFTLDDTGAMTSAAATISGGNISLSATDRVTIVRLSTVGGGRAASTPTGLRVTPDNNQVVLKWAPTFEATSYKVKRSTNNPAGPFNVIQSNLTTTTYTDSTATNGTKYHYVVSAMAPGGESANSFERCAVPTIPVIKDNADGSGITITGSWTASTATAGYYGTNFLHDGNTGGVGGKSVRFSPTLASAGHYDVCLRWTTSGNRATNAPIDINHSGGTATLSLNQQVNNGTWMLLGTFHFNAGSAGNLTVRNDGANGYVVADAVKFVLTIPPAPVGVTGTPGNQQSVLAWSAVPGATGYNVKRATTSGGPQTVLVTNQAGTSYTNTSLVNGTAYYYAIAAVNSGGESIDSAEVRVVPTTPTITIDNTAGSGVTITGAWTASAATPGYYGTNYLHDSNTGGTGGKSVRFTPTIVEAGNYSVYARWTSDPNRASNAPVDVVHAGVTSTLSVNQDINGGAWVLLGVYNFNVGTAGNVKVRNDGANGYVIADAVQFVRKY